MLKTKISRELNALLKAAGLTRAELARKMRVKKSAVTQKLSAESNPSVKSLVGLAEAVGYDVEIRFIKRLAKNNRRNNRDGVEEIAAVAGN